MNTVPMKVALSASNAAWNQFKKYRDDKAVGAYDRLSEAAGSLDGLRERGSELLDDSRREAGNVTKAARARLEKALAEAGDKGQELAEETSKSGKKNLKKAAKAGKRASKKNHKARQKAAAKAARKEKSGNKLLSFGLFAALLAAVAGGAYWWFNRKETPGTTPPRVEEQAGDTETESTLVYSTETPEDAEPAAGKVRSEEELLASLDEQLDKHRTEQDTAEADPVPADSQTPVTDAAEAAEAEEEAEEEPATEDETAASEELLAEGEEIQAEYDRNNSPKRDQSDKD